VVTSPGATAPPLPAHVVTAELRRLAAPLAARGRGRDARSADHGETKYHGVFPHKSGFRAQIKWLGKQLKIATRPTALEAAAELARWYERKLGPNWGEWVTAGRLLPELYPPWQVRWSASRRGWVACAWVAGERKEVTRLRRVWVEVKGRGKGGETVRRLKWEETPELAVFASEARAVERLFVWLVRLYGAGATLVLWRRPKFPDGGG
jgi:hypothetical protein